MKVTFRKAKCTTHRANLFSSLGCVTVLITAARNHAGQEKITLSFLRCETGVCVRTRQPFASTADREMAPEKIPRSRWLSGPSWWQCDWYWCREHGEVGTSAAIWVLPLYVPECMDTCFPSAGSVVGSEPPGAGGGAYAQECQTRFGIGNATEVYMQDEVGFGPKVTCTWTVGMEGKRQQQSKLAWEVKWDLKEIEEKRGNKGFLGSLQGWRSSLSCGPPPRTV